MRWALTPPFHPYHTVASGRFLFCGTFRHELPRAQALPGSLSMEPGLSSNTSPTAPVYSRSPGQRTPDGRNIAVATAVELLQSVLSKS